MEAAVVRVSSGELQRQWGKIQDLALGEPVTVTCNGRDRIVLLSSDEYLRLKKRDREVLTLSSFTESDLQAIRSTEAPLQAAQFDHELKS